MSVKDIQQQLEKLTPEELTQVEQYLKVLRVISAPGFKERIADANRRMDAGQKITQAQFEAMLAAKDKEEGRG